MDTILAQTCPDWELIVCDSYSDDGTWEFFQKYKNDSRIKLHQVPRAGCYAGWNECLNRATGEYIYIATADDTCLPLLIERLVSSLDQNKNVKVAVCDFYSIDAEGRVTDLPNDVVRRKFFGEWLGKYSLRNGKTEFLLHTCFLHAWVTMTSVLFRKSLLDQIGFFSLDRGIVADMEWAMRASLVTDIVFVPVKLATWRRHDQQASRRVNCIRISRDALECVDSVLSSAGDSIPEDWRKLANWSGEIRKIALAQHYDSYALYGDQARNNICRFMKRAGLAIMNEPGFFLRQMMRGFEWSESYSLDPVLHVQNLIKLFQSSWPPSELFDV